MLFRANDASNSNRPSRLLMDFNSSYYSIIVFSQQLFVDTILRLQDLFVQSQETGGLFIYNHLVPPTNATLFAFGESEWSAALTYSHLIQQTSSEYYKLD